MSDNYLMINGKRIELTEEQVATLTKDNTKKDSPFYVKNGDNAYYIDYDFSLMLSDCWNKEDVTKTMPCKDKKLVEQRAKKEHLSRLLWRFAYENNAVPTEDEFNDGSVDKYYVGYDTKTNNYCTSYNKFIISSSEQYFRTKELAQRAIDEVVIPFERGDFD